jgi:uncharacterized protein (DUF2267 family)
MASLEEEVEARRLYQEIEAETNLPLQVTGAAALEAVTCVLSQRLSGGEAEHVADSMPRPVRPHLRRCPRHHQERPDVFGRQGFIERVAAHLQISTPEAERLTRAVFAVVRRWLEPTVIRHVASQLPADIRELWLAPVGTEASFGESPLSESAAPPDAIATALLAQVRDSGALPPGVNEREAFAAVTCTLCERLTRGEAVHLYDQLPPALRPLVQTCALDRPEPAQAFHREEFLRRVGQRLGIAAEDAEPVTRAVLAAVEGVVTPKEVNDVASQLPNDLRTFWPGP